MVHMSKKESILQAATALFSKKGFKDTRMAELCDLTNVAEGTIFYHFKNKEELFLITLEKLKDEIIGEFEAYMSKNEFKSGIHMMEEAISFYLYLAREMEDRFLLFHRHDAYELAKANTTCRDHLEAIYNCLVDIFERCIVVGQKDGSIGEMSARKVALIIFSMVDGLVRLDTYNLYDPSTLYDELIASCRRLLQNSI